MKKRYTTEALKDTQHLEAENYGGNPLGESFMIGYTDGKLDTKLAGWYINRELKEKK